MTSHAVVVADTDGFPDSLDPPRVVSMRHLAVKGRGSKAGVLKNQVG